MNTPFFKCYSIKKNRCVLESGVWVHIFNLTRKQSQVDFCEFQVSQGAYKETLSNTKEEKEQRYILFGAWS